MNIDGTQIQKAGIGVILITGAAVGTVFGVRHIAKKARERAAAQGSDVSLVDSLVTGQTRGFNAQQAAVSFRMAFDNGGSFLLLGKGNGWGVNEDLLLDTLRGIPKKNDFRAVEKIYYDLYGEALMIRLASETQGERSKSGQDLYQLSVNIINEIGGEGSSGGAGGGAGENNTALALGFAALLIGGAATLYIKQK
jgi:hypothetical protein